MILLPVRASENDIEGKPGGQRKFSVYSQGELLKTCYTDLLLT